MTRLRYNNAVGKLGASLGGLSSSPMAYDASSPNTTHYSGGSMVTNSFNAPADSTILVITFGWSSGATYSVSDNSGGALTWHGYGQASGGSLDTVAIYTAKVGGVISGLVVSVYSGPNTAAWCFVLNNVDTAGMGAQAQNSNSTSISLTTTQPNSLVFACHADHASAGQPSGFGSGQSNIINGVAVGNTSGGFAQCAWATTSPQASGTNVSMSYTGGAGANGINIAVELLQSAGTAPSGITFNSAPAFSTVSSPDYIPLVLDPPSGNTPNANFEIVHLTGYSSGSSTGTVARGQEGTVVSAHANGANWLCGQTAADVPAGGLPAHPARAYRNASLSLTANSWNKIPLDTDSFDPGGYFDLANGRYVAPVTGYYQVNGNAQASGSGTWVGLYKNGSPIPSYGDLAGSATSSVSVISDIISLTAGDLLELWVNPASASSLAVGNGAGNNFLSVVPLGT